MLNTQNAVVLKCYHVPYVLPLVRNSKSLFRARVVAFVFCMFQWFADAVARNLCCDLAGTCNAERVRH